MCSCHFKNSYPNSRAFHPIDGPPSPCAWSPRKSTFTIVASHEGELPPFLTRDRRQGRGGVARRLCQLWVYVALVEPYWTLGSHRHRWPWRCHAVSPTSFLAWGWQGLSLLLVLMLAWGRQGLSLVIEVSHSATYTLAHVRAMRTTPLSIQRDATRAIVPPSLGGSSEREWSTRWRGVINKRWCDHGLHEEQWSTRIGWLFWNISNLGCSIGNFQTWSVIWEIINLRDIFQKFTKIYIFKEIY